MLNIQQVTDAIHGYHRNKGFIKRIIKSSHSAIRATESYLQSLQENKGLISEQDLFSINRFFLLDHPVQSGTAAYKAWRLINYHYFCDLNAVRVTQLTQLLKHSVPLKYAGFATCSKAGYQNFPKNFSKLMLAQLDSGSNAEKMDDFFKVLSAAYQQHHFTKECFVALSKLSVEGMLNPDTVNLIRENKHAHLLAECLILMKHNDILTADNQQRLIDFAYLQPLYRTMIGLERIGILTQENFSVISADNNHPWLLALEEMPEDFMTPGIWEGLLSLLKNSDISDFKTDIKAYAEMLRQGFIGEPMEEMSLEKMQLVNEKGQARSSLASTSRLFLVSPVSLPEVVKDTSAKINLVP